MGVIGATNSTVDIKTLLKLANFFNSSLDEVIGRTNFINNQTVQFRAISLKETRAGCKAVITKTLQERSLTPYQLSKNCGIGEVVIHEFIKDTSQKNVEHVNNC